MEQTMPEEEAFKLLKSAFHLSNNQLVYTGSLLPLPNSSLKVIGQFRSTLCELDLSFCLLDHNLKPLEDLFGLQTLVMDNCGITDKHCLPYLHELQTLSLNKNQLCDLSHILDQIRHMMPLLRHLSLLGNLVCPHAIIDESEFATENQYDRYRVHVAHTLPQLKFLDALPLSQVELLESYHSGHVALTWKQWSKSWVTSLQTMSGSDGLKRTSSSSSTYSSCSSKGQPNISKLMAQSKMSYEKLKYRYSGNHSEGNRFITDIDL